MSFLRPEARAALARWSEGLVALAVVGFGGWLIWLGGYLLAPVGALFVLAGAGWGLTEVRRLRFQRPVAAPGLVEIDEGQVGYLGPDFGGYVALRELAEVRLIRLHGLPHWRLKQADGQALLIPHQAQGAAALFDAFAALPGADMAAFTAALDRPADTQTVWTQPARSLPPRP
ncbi:MAG: hypothetical protein JSR87_06625 [Proteobacteria bacterium]|nr:hypothetical protein [Pseudomonadota bacterium]MBS0573029.1 hypothetical protein [Pseudomonadota bacterium]